MRGFRAIVVGHAPEPGVPALLRRLKPSPADLLVAVDGGMKHFQSLKVLPDILIGDFDSFKPSRIAARARRAIKFIRLAPDKDHSDLYYALQTALVIGASEIVAIGFSGGRTDHALAALADLSKVAEAKGLRSVQLVSASEVIHFLSPSIPVWREKLSKGTRVSIIALSDQVGGARWKGLKFSPNEHSSVLKPGSRGLSNFALGGEASFSLHRGRAVVIVGGHA